MQHCALPPALNVSHVSLAQEGRPSPPLRSLRQAQLLREELEGRNLELANKVEDLRSLLRRLHQQRSEQVQRERARGARLSQEHERLRKALSQAHALSSHLSMSAQLFR